MAFGMLHFPCCRECGRLPLEAWATLSPKLRCVCGGAGPMEATWGVRLP